MEVEATPGRALALIIALAAWSSCSASTAGPPAAPSATSVTVAPPSETAATVAPPAGTPATSATPPFAIPATPAPGSKRLQVCVGDAPPEWVAAFQARTLQLPEGVRFGLSAPSSGGQAAFGQFDSKSARGIGSVDFATGELTRITTYAPGTSGLWWMAVELPWIVWTQGNSSTNIGDWSLLAKNQQSGEQLTLATSRLADGSDVFGQPPFPALRGGIVGWAQPLPRRAANAEAELRLFDLARRQESVLSKGRVSSPVFAGRYLVWARRADSDGRYSFEAVDAESLTPAALPERLRDPGSVLYLAGSRRYLAWSDESSLRLTLWRIDSNEYREYASPDIRHYFQFLKLAGSYLLWYGGITSTVLDLETGNAFEVQGTLTGSDEMILKEEPVGQAPRGEFAASRVSAVVLSAAPGIASCSRR